MRHVSGQGRVDDFALPAICGWRPFRAASAGNRGRFAVGDIAQTSRTGPRRVGRPRA